MSTAAKGDTYVPGSGSNPELLVGATGSNPELLVSLAGEGDGGSGGFGSTPELSRPRPVPTISRPSNLQGPIPQVSFPHTLQLFVSELYSSIQLEIPDSRTNNSQ